MKDNNIIDLLNYRFACKEYDPAKKVSNEDIKIILEAGRLSPSSFGFEPWQLNVTEDKQLIKEISEVAWGLARQEPGVSHLVIIYVRNPNSLLPNSPYLKSVMKDIKHMSEIDIENRKVSYHDFMENDFEMLDKNDVIFEWARSQSFLSLQSMMLAAASLKIDTTPIEGFNRDRLEELLISKGYLDKTEFSVGCLLAIGYRLNDPEFEKTRRSYEDVIKWLK